MYSCMSLSPSLPFSLPSHPPSLSRVRFPLLSLSLFNPFFLLRPPTSPRVPFCPFPSPCSSLSPSSRRHTPLRVSLLLLLFSHPFRVRFSALSPMRLRACLRACRSLSRKTALFCALCVLALPLEAISRRQSHGSQVACLLARRGVFPAGKDVSRLYSFHLSFSVA